MTPQEELIKEAAQWVGVTEHESIDVFRRAVDGVASDEAWCAGFVQYCCVRVADRTGASITLPVSELCTYIWNNTDDKYKIRSPEPGAIVVWKTMVYGRGHIGIIEKIGVDKGTGRALWTIEGNTTSPDSPARGVFRKLRSPKGNTEMCVLGFIRPFR